MLKTQTTRFSPIDEDTQIVQKAEVTYDKEAECEWVSVSNGGDSMTMSFENWDKLCQLVAASRIEAGL